MLLLTQIGLVGPDGRDLPLHLKPTGAAGKHKGNGHKGSDSGSSSGKGSSKPATSPEGIVHSTGLQGSVSTSLVLLVDGWSQSFTFTRLPDKPCVSLLRDFSAPVRLDVEGETDKTLGFLATHDSNPFARCSTRLVTKCVTEALSLSTNKLPLCSCACWRVVSGGGSKPPVLTRVHAWTLLHTHTHAQVGCPAAPDVPATDAAV